MAEVTYYVALPFITSDDRRRHHGSGHIALWSFADLAGHLDDRMHLRAVYVVSRLSWRPLSFWTLQAFRFRRQRLCARASTPAVWFSLA
jgi:hypothetical protein